MLLQTLGLAAHSMADTQTDLAFAIVDRKQLEDDFFGVEESPVILAGKITRRMAPRKAAKGHVNRFLRVADRFIFPTIFLLENYQIVSKNAEVLNRGLFALSTMMDCAQNHWEIERFSKASFNLWLRLRNYVVFLS